MNLGLDMSMKLQQKLSFQMIQSLKLLQVNTLQLEQMLQTELEMNPLLEAEDSTDSEQSGEQTQEESPENNPEEDLKTSEDDVDWEEYLEEGFDLGYSFNEERDPNEEQRESITVYQETLDEHLSKQLVEKKIPEKESLLVQFIIGSLDNDGYLRLDPGEIASFTQYSVYEVEEALSVVQGMDPVGVGSRNLRECMMIQLRRRGESNSLAMRIIDESWDLFERMKISEISRKFAVGPRDIQEAIEVLKTLNPKPGYQFAAERSSTIVPDLIVEKIDGEFVVMLNDRSIPSLRISNAYARMLKRGNKTRGDVKKYIRDKFNSASWFIRAIEQRKSTMLRVMYAILEKQREFFEKGPPNINPLKLQDIADMVEMHISTISRVTNNKYVQTRHGIFELKYFFTEAISSGSSGVADVSTERIKDRIREMVANEDTSQPLSDQKIAEQLGKEGMAVARRTVAKYREQLKLLPARLRLKYE